MNDAGVNTNNWPGPWLEYRRRTRRINPGEYRAAGNYPLTNVQPDRYRLSGGHECPIMEAMNEALSASPRRGRAAGLRFAGEDGLARRATAGDTAAFAEIFRRYNRELGRYCQAILGSREQAEDALQNTIVSAMKALPGETREIALKPWLYRVAYNESISLLRQRRPTAELDTELAEPGSDLGERAERREGLRALLGDLEMLPERQRGALVMRELSDLSFAEIAGTFEFSEGAARQAVYEARGALTEMAEGRDMECAAIRAQISEDDKRVLRGRRLRAHLRECEGCRHFEAAIRDRRAEFAQIAPLAPAAAAAILHSVLGTSAAGGGSGGLAALGGAAGGTAALKSAAAVVAVVAAGVGTADLAGVVDLNGSATGRRRRSPNQPRAPARARRATPARRTTELRRDKARRRAAAAIPARARVPAGRTARGQGQGNANGQGRTSPWAGQRAGQRSRQWERDGGGNGVGQTGTPPGQAQTPPGQTQTPPGQSGSSSAAARTPTACPRARPDAARPRDAARPGTDSPRADGQHGQRPG